EAGGGVIKKKWWTTGGVLEGRVVDERGQSVAGARLSLVWPLLGGGISQIQRTLDVVSGTDGQFSSRVYFGGEKAVVTSQMLRFVPEDTLAAGAARSPIGVPWNGFVEVVNEPAARNRALSAQSRVDALSTFPPKPADRS